MLFFAADLGFKIGRKLSQKEEVREGPKNQHPKNPSEHQTPKIVGMATTGGVLVLCCCGFLCACFQRKRKASSHTVLAKEPHSSE